MKVRALRHGDVGARALFEGQIYDVPDDLVAAHKDWLVPLIEEKAVEAPPRDKAVRPRSNKGLGGS